MEYFQPKNFQELKLEHTNMFQWLFTPKCKTVGTSEDFGYLGRLHDKQAALGCKDQIKGGATKVALRGGGSCAQDGIYRASSHRDTPRFRSPWWGAECSHFHT
jgi:hypothetical protein